MSSSIKFEEKLTGVHKVIGMAIPLSSEYLPMIAIEAFHKVLAEHPQWKLKIIGFGKLFSGIQTYIKSNSLQNNIQLFGPLEKSEMYDVLKRTDIMLLPSDIDNEGLYKSIITLGTPVIIHENHKLNVLAKSDSGFILYNGSEKHMTERMNYTIKNINKFDVAALRELRMCYDIVN